MTANRTNALRERTESKLRYARVHLDELKSQSSLSGSDFDRAHQESFLFHLLGAQDAFLGELNHIYGAGLAPDALSPGKIREALSRRGMRSVELRTLYELEQDTSSWLSAAKAMREHSTHVQGVSRAYHLGGEDHQKVKIRHPKTGTPTEHDFVIEFEKWLTKMESLIGELRASALAANEQ